MPGQKPVLTPETTTTARDPVVREVFGINATYASLSSPQQAVVSQEIDSAFMEVVARGKWFSEIDPSSVDLPTEWNELLRAMAVAKLRRHFRSPQDYHAYWTVNVQPLQERIADHYSSSWNVALPLAGEHVNVQTMRMSVVAVLIRQRNPVFWPLKEVDRIIRDEFVRLWYSRFWNFRRLPAKLTFKTDGTIVSAATLPFAGLASRYFVVEGSDGSRSRCTWVDSTRAAEIACAMDGTTGKPTYFADSWSGGSPTIALYPIPDQEYTAYATIYGGARDFTSSTTDGIRDLPPPFRVHLRDRCIATILSQSGREDVDSARWMKRVDDDFARLLPAADDMGPAHSSASPHHVGGVVGGLMSSDWSMTLSPIG